MPSPCAEVDIDGALITAMLRGAFPTLAGPVEIVANGWDNVIARVGTDLCVRMPRRSLSARLVQHEAAWLPVLAPLLPVDVPVPVAVGQPAMGYPWTWLICPGFEGRPLTAVPVRDRVGVAAQVGAFVAALHCPSPPEAPVSRWRGISLADLEPTVLARLERIALPERAVLRGVWNQCIDSPPHAGPAMWLHGDLHPLNVLTGLDAPPELRAVLDWGDLCCGDPATDLAIAWLAFDEQGRAAFQAAAAVRHPLSDAVWTRARGWAVSLGLLFLLDADPGSVLHDIGAHLLSQLKVAS